MTYTIAPAAVPAGNPPVSAGSPPVVESRARAAPTVPFVPNAVEVRELARHCLRYRDAEDARAWRQLALTFGLYAATVGLLLAALVAGFWAALPLALPGGLLLVRVFTIQHDCGHGSYFSSRAANNGVGRALSLLTLTPYGYWRRTHALHHSSAGDLGRRGIGDVDTYTVREFAALSPRQRWLYRLYRHPLVLHVLGPPLYFLLLQRSPFGQALPPREAWRSIVGLNVSMIVFYGAMMWAFGVWPVLAAFGACASVAAWVGSWLFYVQHQFEDTHWEESQDWHLQTAALHGSSHYVLPRWLDWLTGHIGLHHIHHLNSRVPSYRLTECMAGDARLARISRLTLRESLGSIGLSLWDEETRRLISFREARAA